MKALSKLFVVMISLALLTGCNFLSGKVEPDIAEIDQEVKAIIEAEDAIEEDIVELESMEIDELSALDEEMDSLIEEEAAIDASLDDLESQEF